jgi:hypothetical protein
MICIFEATCHHWLSPKWWCVGRVLLLGTRVEVRPISLDESGRIIMRFIVVEDHAGSVVVLNVSKDMEELFQMSNPTSNQVV